MDNFSFIMAKPGDSQIILSFIHKIAIYEKMDEEVKATVESLDEWVFKRNLVEVISLLKDNKEIGFALYFYNFSTFNGKPGIHLEDFYIDEEYRGRGLGKKLFLKVVEKAKEVKAGRMEWTCLNWNKPSIAFYTKVMKAAPMSEWTTYRLREDQYEGLLKENK